MPLFTHETAVTAGIKSGEARRARSLVPAPEPVQPHMNELEKEMVRDTVEELRRCREFLRQCRDPKLFVQLTTAKERLWNLVFPKAGTRKPLRDDVRRRPLPVAQDVWQREPLATPQQELAEPPAR
jgi:hypothetical protein